jgi:hypothetical protein
MARHWRRRHGAPRFRSRKSSGQNLTLGSRADGPESNLARPSADRAHLTGAGRERNGGLRTRGRESGHSIVEGRTAKLDPKRSLPAFRNSNFMRGHEPVPITAPSGLPETDPNRIARAEALLTLLPSIREQSGSHRQSHQAPPTADCGRSRQRGVHDERQTSWRGWLCHRV